MSRRPCSCSSRFQEYEKELFPVSACYTSFCYTKRCICRHDIPWAFPSRYRIQDWSIYRGIRKSKLHPPCTPWYFEDIWRRHVFRIWDIRNSVCNGLLNKRQHSSHLLLQNRELSSWGATYDCPAKSYAFRATLATTRAGIICRKLTCSEKSDQNSQCTLCAVKFHLFTFLFKLARKNTCVQATRRCRIMTSQRMTGNIQQVPYVVLWRHMQPQVGKVNG